MTTTFRIRIRRAYPPPVGQVEAVLELPESQRWAFLAWLMDGELRDPAGPRTEPQTEIHETETNPTGPEAGYHDTF